MVCTLHIEVVIAKVGPPVQKFLHREGTIRFVNHIREIVLRVAGKAKVGGFQIGIPRRGDTRAKVGERFVNLLGEHGESYLLVQHGSISLAAHVFNPAHHVVDFQSPFTIKRKGVSQTHRFRVPIDGIGDGLLSQRDTEVAGLFMLTNFCLSLCVNACNGFRVNVVVHIP